MHGKQERGGEVFAMRVDMAQFEPWLIEGGLEGWWKGTDD